MKITKFQLKQIILEELGGLAGNLAGQRPEQTSVEDVPDTEIQSLAVEFFMNMGIDKKASIVMVRNIAIPDLVSVMKKIPALDTAAEEEALSDG